MSTYNYYKMKIPELEELDKKLREIEKEEGSKQTVAVFLFLLIFAVLILSSIWIE